VTIHEAEVSDIGALLEATAYEIFQRCDALDDFCIQAVGERAVFGGTNRLTFSPVNGWGVERSCCTPRFLEEWDAIAHEYTGRPDGCNGNHAECQAAKRGRADDSSIKQLTAWLRAKIEAGRINWENDAPYVEGLLEAIEAGRGDAPKRRPVGRIVQRKGESPQYNINDVYAMLVHLEKKLDRINGKV